jgi:hypothetical protein
MGRVLNPRAKLILGLRLLSHHLALFEFLLPNSLRRQQLYSNLPCTKQSARQDQPVLLKSNYCFRKPDDDHNLRNFLANIATAKSNVQTKDHHSVCVCKAAHSSKALASAGRAFGRNDLVPLDSSFAMNMFIIDYNPRVV